MKLSWATLASGDDHGYAVVSKELCTSIVRAGAEIVLAHEESDLTVVFALPARFFFYKGQSRTDLIYHTMLEVDPAPPKWIPVLNLCRAVWTPSQWVADVFARDGVVVPIFVSGYGISPQIHHPATERAPGPFRIGVWGDTFATRKNVAMAIQAYVAAGLPESTLEVKVNAPRSLTPTFWKTDGAIDDRVTILNESWSAVRLTDWLRSLDLMLYLSGGEGYGLMPLEAMACGVPVVAMRVTGMLEYMTAQNVIEVPAKGMKESAAYIARFPSDGYRPMLFEPDFDAVVEKMRWAYGNQDDAAEVGRRAAASVAGTTWDLAGKQAIQNLERFL